MHTKALKSLVRIAEVGSFATAASQLGITLSALSMQMKTLEQDLGASLFDRSFRPPKLTPIGRRVAEQSLDVIAAESALLEACNQGEALNGTYRLGFVATASVRLLPSFLKQAASSAPDVHFDLETGLSDVLEEKVLSGQLDAAVVTASGETSSALHYDVLRREELLYAIPEKFSDVPMKELINQLPFLQFNPKSGIGKVIDGYISELGARNKRSIGLDSVEAIMECVNQNIGFTLLSAPDIERYAKSRIHLIKPKGSGIFRQLVLASSDRGISPSTRKHLVALFDQ